MRILKIASYYNSFIKYYYKKFPDISTKTYTEQHQHLMNQCVGWSDFYSTALRKKGVEAYEIVYNATKLQHKWAEEHNLQLTGINILSKQIEEIKPDIIWFQDSFSFDIDFIKMIKNKVKSIKLLIGNLCSPYSDKDLEKLKFFDFVTTCSPVFVDKFKEVGIKTMMLYHAFAPEITKIIGGQKKETDIIFIGSIVPVEGFHFERKKFLETIARNSNIEFSFYGNLVNTNFFEVKKSQLLYIAKIILKMVGADVFLNKSAKFRKIDNFKNYPKYLKLSNELLSSYKGRLFGIDMFTELAKSKLTFDIQGEIGGDYAATMRIFEATGSGLCLLVENKKNISELFEPDKEIVVFDNTEEAIEKINFLINNQAKLLEIGKAAQKRVFKDHTYDNRATQLISEINNFL